MNTGAADQTARSGIEGTGKAACEDLIYEPNPKHKEPWQRGARGSLCPRDADGPALLAISLVDPQHLARGTLLTVAVHTAARSI